jgi:3-deoxy-7-phosphoheptulonate synthase
MTERPWHPGSWRDRPAAQMPLYADAQALLAAERALSQAAPIAAIEESERLRQMLAEAAQGRAFLLQGGDCAETFDEPSRESIRDLVGLFDDLSTTIGSATATSVIPLARIAGQSAKPRGASVERREEITLPIYRGDLINHADFNPGSRQADPARMLRGHAHALSVKSLLSELPKPLFSSHEALLLPYEEPLVRRDSPSGAHWSVSAHFLWVGDRTRQLDGAHIEFLSGIANPVGVKCGPTLTSDELLRLCELLDPLRSPGRLTLIVRLGAERIGAALPDWMRALRREGRQPLWVSDPMHGNTERGGVQKVRRFETMLTEAQCFFAIAAAEGTWPGGLHLEMTPEPVTECLGGPGPSDLAELTDWRSACDPRLNGNQARQFVREVASVAARAAAA